MTTHDYRKHLRCWGHDYTYSPRNGGLQASMSGWGPLLGAVGSVRIQVGDLLLLSHPAGGVSTYRVDEIRYEQDPPDMWHAEVTYAAQPVTQTGSQP